MPCTASTFKFLFSAKNRSRFLVLKFTVFWKRHVTLDGEEEKEETVLTYREYNHKGVGFIKCGDIRSNSTKIQIIII